jgi:hypothetical protein
MIVPMEDLKLSVQRALVTNVFPSLRAVCVESRKNLIFLCFYCDGEASDDDRECCESVFDEVSADFFYASEDKPLIEFEVPIVRLDYPKKIPLIGEWVYYRYEDSSKYID